jgi:hypothetical protein
MGRRVVQLVNDTPAMEAIMRYVLFSLALGCALSLSGGAFADDAPPAQEGPCKKIVEACKAAGYAHHAKEKNLHKDCMAPLLHGKTVDGVTVQADDVQACQARIQAHHKS